MKTKRDLLLSIQDLAIECGESGFPRLGACLAFVGAAASMCKEGKAAEALAPISQRASDEAERMKTAVN